MKDLIIFILLAIAFNVNTQEYNPASGGNASGGGGSVSYTVGQVAYNSNTGVTGSVAQGIQQPYEISVVTGIEDAPGITLQYSVYPNPAKDFLILSIEGESPSHYAASLYDISGNMLKSLKVESKETKIDMSNLAIAAYFLKVYQTNHTSSVQEIKTFKIIKN